MLRRNLVFFTLIFLLTGCEIFQRRTERVPVLLEDPATKARQALINLPGPPVLEPLIFDWPRQANGQQLIRQTPECLSVTLPEQTPDFWSRCGLRPVDQTSNIYIGLSYEQWLIYQKNTLAIDSWMRLVRQRIEAVRKLDRSVTTSQTGAIDSPNP